MDEAEERLRAQSEELHKLEALVASSGWARLMEIADGQRSLRLVKVLAPLPNLMELGILEFEKGELQGIRLFTLIPEKRIEDLKTMVIATNKEIDDARPSNRNANRDASEDGSAPGLGAGPGDGI